MIPIKPLDKQIRDLGDEENYAVPRVKTNSNYWMWILIGGKGSGKSSVLLNVLENKLLGLYENIYLISPTAELDPKFKKLVEELKVDNHFYEHFSEKVIDTIMNDLRHKETEKEKEKETPKKGVEISKKGVEISKKGAELSRNLIIFDDCIADLPKSTVKNATFNKLMCNHRHFHSDIIITSQVYRLLNPTVRKNFNIITIWPSVNKGERKAYLDEINVDEDLLYQLIDMTSRDNYGNLTINFMKRSTPKFFSNFKPLRICESAKQIN